MQDPEYIKRFNIIDMGLGFTSMLRTFASSAKKEIHKKIMQDILLVFQANSKTGYDEVHRNFCRWGISNVMQPEKRKKETQEIIINARPASYGQVAKAFDVVMKVTIYYSYLPDISTAQKLMPFLNAAVDTQMMEMLTQEGYRHYIKPWPRYVSEVNAEEYQRLQQVVRQFIKDRHNSQILPVQFDDIYWKQLNR